MNDYGTLKEPIKISPNTKGCMKPSKFLYAVRRALEDDEPLALEDIFCASSAFINMLDAEERITTGNPLDPNHTYYGFKLIDIEYPDRTLGLIPKKDETRIIMIGRRERDSDIYDLTYIHWVNGMEWA